MSFSCKGKCYKNRKYGGYKFGDKRCTMCEKYIETDSIFCFCCGVRLRANSRWLKKEEVIRIE